jgi:hypothetical protein
MRSSTSSSESFFSRACALLASAGLITLALAALFGRLHRPQPLSPAPAEVAAVEREVVGLGNSHFEAAIDPDAVTRAFATHGERVTWHQYTGGGWNALQYLMLAQLAGDVLRPGRDLVLIDASPVALNEAEEDDHLGTIRPDAAWSVARLPGLPMESRLDVLLGALSPLYRYRTALQAAFWAHLEPLVARRAPARLVRPSAAPPPFTLVTDPGRNFVIREVRGDREQFRAQHRRWLDRWIARARFGGYKREALIRAVAGLRARGIDVVLVETPTSGWFRARFDASEAGVAYRAALTAVAQAAAGRLLDHWPARFDEDDRYWDDYHLASTQAADFDAVLVEQLVALLGR